MTSKCSLSKIAEIHPSRIFEVFAEMRQIIESKGVSHHFHIGVVVHDQALRLLHHPLPDMIAGGMARHLLYHLGQIAWGDKKLIGIVGHLLHRPELVVEFRVEAVEKPGAVAAPLLLPDGGRLSFHINKEYFEKSAEYFQS